MGTGVRMGGGGSSQLICVSLFTFTTQPEEERERESGETNGRTHQNGQQTNGVEGKTRPCGREKRGQIRWWKSRLAKKME